MKIVASKKMPSKIISCFNDGVMLYYMTSSNNLIEINTFDPETFESVSSFSIFYNPNLFSKPTVDEHFVYLPSADGRIIAIDKFSGKMEFEISLGMMICVSDIEQDQEYVYTVCRVPLTNGIKSMSHGYCVCKNEKISGKKINQSQLFQGKPSQLLILNDKCWIIFDKKIYKLSNTLELENSSNILNYSKYKPFIHKDYVCLASSLGYLEIFEYDMKPVTKIFIGKNRVVPFSDRTNIYVITENKIFCISSENKVQEIQSLDTMYAEYIYKNEFLYMADETGRLASFDFKQKSLKKLGVSQLSLRELTIIDNNIFTHDKSGIYKIEII